MEGWTAFPQFPPSLFNVIARVAYSLAIWPQPWHLKHCRALESFAFWALGTPPTLGSSGYPTCSRRAAIRGVLAQASPTIVGAGAGRSIPVHRGYLEQLQGECPILLCLELPLAWQFGHPALLSCLSLQWQQMTLLLLFLLHPPSCSQLFWLLP